jgi:hypothetical protein
VSASDFKYARCLMKHFVRRDGWLKACKHRLVQIRKGVALKYQRRLRYFTFPAESAVDVLMLDVAKVVRPSHSGRFDTVFFFNRSEESVAQTRKSVPGAVGFPGDFVEVVLVNDPIDNDAMAEAAALGLLPTFQDTLADRARISRVQAHRDFRAAFPFDVLNLDLEGYLFKPTDSIPGRVINAFRKVFEWQRSPLVDGARWSSLSGFTLLLTVRVGPKNLSADLLAMLRQSLESNLHDDADLQLLMKERTGVSSVAELAGRQFEAFFRLATPKLLAQLLNDTDWYVDPEAGIVVYQFERTPERGEPYKMLHFVMDVVRHDPPIEHRAPGVRSQAAADAYRSVVRQIFERQETVVTLESIDADSLNADLALIDARRRKYEGET